MEKTISIILNSRHRVPSLINLFNSITSTASNIKNVEVLVSFDNDDFDSIYGLSDFKSVDHPILDVLRFYFIDRDRNLHKRLNYLARISKGKYIWVLNDDCEIITQNWDQIISTTLDHSFDDGIVYGHIEDTSCDKVQNAEYASFPVISRKAVDTVGYFMNNALPGLGGDVHIWRLYNSIHRIIKCPVMVRHIMHETVERVINTDATALEMRQKTYEVGIDCWALDIEQDKQKIENYLNTYKVTQ